MSKVIDEDFIVEKVEQAIKGLLNGKSFGPYLIRNEHLKQGGNTLLSHLTKLLTKLSFLSHDPP